jgi:hypothetical protein
MADGEMVLPATGVVRMKKILALVALLAASPAVAQDMSNAEYWNRVATNNWAGDLVSFNPDKPKIDVPSDKKMVAELVAYHARKQLGEKWVDSALKLAKLESSFNCRATGPATPYGRAKGVMQMIDGSAKALGFDPKRMHECDYGIQAGIAHMQKCLEHGVKTHRDMASCHVSGWKGWNVKLASKRSEKYRREYIRLAMR